MGTIEDDVLVVESLDCYPTAKRTRAALRRVLDDHARLVAENERMRGALERIAMRCLGVLTRLSL